MPKVSVVIPCYNVEKYLRQCLDSVVNQTLRDIEIICVNDGSTDSTPAILQEYAEKDERVRIIDKPNSGYGHSMNCGVDMAEGEYLGIVESDDFVELDMFEKLYQAAASNNLDVAKAGFFRYSTSPKERNVPIRMVYKAAGKDVFCPINSFRNPRKKAAFFKAIPAIWSGIYRKQFLTENKIRFLETPGASYQDLGFCQKVWIKAERVQILKECLLHYRVDNASSSVRSSGKVYCICDEYAELDRFLQENPVERELALPVLLRAKYESYLWNYERLTEPFQAEFIHRFHEEFSRHQEEGVLNRAYFLWYDWNNLQKILRDPQLYHEIMTRKLCGESAPDFYDSYCEDRPFRVKGLYVLAEKLSGAAKYVHEEGLLYTLKLTWSKADSLLKEKTKQKEPV